jgi:hypothetical protein
MRRNTVESFWARVRCGNPDECWPWQGAKSDQGYGRVSGFGLRNVGAHRIAFGLTHGWDAISAVFVLHRCDNPPCCNPAHLFAGTAQDNALDMVAKGRDKGTRWRKWQRLWGRRPATSRARAR